MHDRERGGRQDVVGRPRRSAAPTGGAAGVVALQASAGNRAVAQRLAEAGVGGDVEGGEVGGTHRCGGAVALVDGDLGGGDAVPLQVAAGGRTLTWADFRTVPAPIDGLDARTGFAYGFSGATFTARFRADRSWATSAAKTGAGSTRLLAHEQGHLDLAVVLAAKATAHGVAGQAGLDLLLAASERHTAQYDADTDHGTIATAQATWDQRIMSGDLTYP